MLKSISTNDLRGLKKHIEDNYSLISNDISSIKYTYSVEPYIYTIDGTKKIAKVNPNNLFSSMFSGNMMSNLSTYTSIYSQMIDNFEILNKSYDILKGRWPEKYDEMVLVLSDPNSISDLLVYSLGLRDTEELKVMINKVMTGESVDINHEPMNLSYDELLNLDLRLIMPTDMYKYNDKYNVYMDMSEDENYVKSLYENALKLKIVGSVAV